MRNDDATALSASGARALYTPQHVANYFLDRAADEGRDITPLKLIKLVYIAYGWVLALLGAKLFSEQIEAWRHGPVVPSLYHEFKHFGKDPITSRSLCIDDGFDFGGEEPRIEDNSPVLAVLDKVWAAYRRFSGWALREKTHALGTPWHESYAVGQNRPIEDRLIAPHYKQKIRELLDAVSA